MRVCLRELGVGGVVLAVALLSCGGQIAADSLPRDEQPDGSTSGASDDPSADASATTKTDAMVDAATPDAAPPPQADGVCSPTSVSAGVFDADCVYLLGTLSQNGDAWKDALINVSQPNDYATGFGYVTLAPIVRPTDGRVLFEAAGDHTPRGVYRYVEPFFGYADSALAKQKLETSVTCSASMLDVRFHVFPDDGAILYGCGDQFFVAGSPVDLAGNRPAATGRNRLIVAAKTYPDIFLVQNGVVTPVPGFTGTPITFRSLPSGTMWMASANGVQADLREIALDGSMHVVGAYNFGPPIYRQSGQCALEPSGALVCIVTLADSPPAEGVARFTFANPPEVVYDERTGPVKIQIGALVTGP